MAIVPGKTRLAGGSLTKQYILFNTTPPCPSQTGERTAVKQEDWRETTFHEG